MFLLKNSNLVSLNLGGRGVSIVFSRIEKEIKVSSWKKKKNGNVSGKGSTLVSSLEQTFRKASSKRWGETKCLPLPPGPDSEPIPLPAFVFKETCLGCLLLRKHCCSQWTGHISQAMWYPEVHWCLMRGEIMEGRERNISTVWIFSKCSSSHDSKLNDLALMAISGTTFHMKRRKAYSHTYVNETDKDRYGKCLVIFMATLSSGGGCSKSLLLHNKALQSLVVQITSHYLSWFCGLAEFRWLLALGVLGLLSNGSWDWYHLNARLGRISIADSASVCGSSLGMARTAEGWLGVSLRIVSPHG